MIADLTRYMSNLGRTHKFMTHRSVLFPAPGVISTNVLEKGIYQWFERHTLSMNPQQRSLGFPFCQCITLEKPRCSSFMSCFSNEVLIRRRVRGREPVVNVLLQLVAYKIPSVMTIKKNKGKDNKRWVLFILFNIWRIVTTT